MSQDPKSSQPIAPEDPLPTPGQMIEHLDLFVHGQARAKQDLAVAVYNHYLSQAFREREGVDLGRHHILLLGPTGVGKTYMVRTLAEFLGVPVGFSSAAGLVEAGFKGNSVETLVSALLDRALGDPRLAEKGIVFLDEVDKIKRGETGGARDISGEGVQNALLTLLDGRRSEGLESGRHPTVDTSRLLFVCAGAFVGLNELVDARLQTGNSQFGFRLRREEENLGLSDQPVYSALCQAQTKDLVEFGMIPEFIGRFATITALHELDHQALRAILDSSMERTALGRQKELARIHGIELVIEDEALDAIASAADELGTGARGLHRLIGRAVDGVDHRWPDLADEGVTRVVVNRACVEDDQEPLLERGQTIWGRTDQELRLASRHGLPPRPASDPRHSPGPSSGRRLSNTSSWSDAQVEQAILKLKREHLDWANTTGSAQLWWEAFEKENQARLPLVLRLCEELRNRSATITEFFLAFVYSNTDNIQANLHYLDYTRLKREEEKKRRKKKDPDTD